jgi:hypothetical protein
VRVSIASYLGADVSGATVRLSWSVPLSSGTINVTTNAEGRAEAVIPLGALPQANATGPGDGLEVKAAWVGPTGDPYNERVFVRCVSYGIFSAACSCLGQCSNMFNNCSNYH